MNFNGLSKIENKNKKTNSNKLEYQLHGLELKFVFAFLNHPLRVEDVDVYHVDVLFHRESRILIVDNMLYVFDNDYYHHLNFRIRNVSLRF